MGHPGTSVFVFQTFRIDPAKRLLSRDGQPITLTPKEFDTLLVLVEACGRVVAKDDLIARVWPNSYVGDGSLARNISVLRRTLGEDVIETHRRRGYRIKVEVRALTNEAEQVQEVKISTLSRPESEPRMGQPGPQYEISTPGETRQNWNTPSISLKKAAPWWRSAAILSSAIVMILLVTELAWSFLRMNMAHAYLARVSANAVHSILIQHKDAIDPHDEGFRLDDPDGGYRHIMRNPDDNGFDRWRVISQDQTFYYRRLSEAEKDFALERDWRLTCVCALVEGAGSSDIDFAGKGPRFDMGYIQEGNKFFVVLTIQISPRYESEQKVEFSGLNDAAHPHTYELLYDHVSKTASLWIDGRLKASGYRGHHQYQENVGVSFGAATYRNMPESTMVFRSVKFEAE